MNFKEEFEYEEELIKKVDEEDMKNVINYVSKALKEDEFTNLYFLAETKDGKKHNIFSGSESWITKELGR